MATSGFNLSSAPQPSISDVVEQKLRAERVVKSGAGWFITIAALSAVNSILNMSSAQFHFIFGLGITEVVDAIAKGVTNGGIVLDLIINGFIAGLGLLGGDDRLRVGWRDRASL